MPCSSSPFTAAPSRPVSGAISAPSVPPCDEGRASPHAPPIRQPLFHPPGRSHRAERIRVELAAGPLQELFVLLMVRVGDGLEEVRVAPDPAHVLRRARPLALQAARIP